MSERRANSVAERPPKSFPIQSRSVDQVLSEIFFTEQNALCCSNKNQNKCRKFSQFSLPSNLLHCWSKNTIQHTCFNTLEVINILTISCLHKLSKKNIQPKRVTQTFPTWHFVFSVVYALSVEIYKL